MTTTFKTIICLLSLYILAIACSDNASSKTKKPLNPNGDSELAILMRTMFDELQIMKTQIVNEEANIINLDHEKILSAHATEPEKANSDEYKAFAAAYLNTLKSINDVPANLRQEQFSNLVTNCMSCHKALCPGPIVKIKKLL